MTLKLWMSACLHDLLYRNLNNSIGSFAPMALSRYVLHFSLEYQPPAIKGNTVSDRCQPKMKASLMTKIGKPAWGVICLMTPV